MVQRSELRDEALSYFGEHKALTDVYYIPKLKSNIISLGQLEERGCKIVLEDGYLWGYDRQRMLLMKVRDSPIVSTY